MQDTLVVIPTYNEFENIENIVARVLAVPAHLDVLIVDDNSPDGTGDIADRLASEDDRVNVLHRAVKDGLGGAYREGFAWALERDYWAVVEMDADGSHHPEDLPRMIELLAGHDLVLGSRWVPGGKVENWPLRRRILSRGGNLYTRHALGIDVKDATGGFRVFSAKALRDLDLSAVASQGYCFQVDLLWRALQRGLRVVETPITFTERELGASKMSSSIVVESLLRVTLWGLGRRRRDAASLVTSGHRLPSVRNSYHRALPQGR